jgi:hypothetical protein
MRQGVWIPDLPLTRQSGMTAMKLVPLFDMSIGTRSKRSPDEVKRNPGQASPYIPDFAIAPSGLLAGLVMTVTAGPDLLVHAACSN